MSRRVVTTASDDNYILPLLVMLYSAKVNARHDFYVVIGYIEEDLSSINRNLVSSILDLLNIDFEFRSVQVDSALTPSSYITRTSLVRLSLMDNLGGIVLWLDADLICLPGWDNLLDFSIINSKKSLAAGVVDPLVTHSRLQRNSKNMAVTEMGSEYINSGVLQINCDLWKELEVPRNWRIAASSYHKFGFQFLDQCILNFVFKNSYVLLPSRFNFLAAVPQKIPFEDVSVLHFAGGSKPWHYSVFSLRSLVSVLRHRDVMMYKSFQNRLIQEMEESNEAHSITLSEIAFRMSTEIRILSLIKHRVVVKPYFYPYLRKFASLRDSGSAIFAKIFKATRSY
jgi:lipopolysaccharide biosynthesis glycosyltransferase